VLTAVSCALTPVLSTTLPRDTTKYNTHTYYYCCYCAIQKRKERLRPLIEALKEARREAQEVDAEHTQRRGAYEKVLSAILTIVPYILVLLLWHHCTDCSTIELSVRHTCSICS
jgi:hypothetical protein